MKRRFLAVFFIALIVLSFTAICQAENQEAYTQAVELYNKGDMKNATLLFEEIVKESPDNADAQAYLGMIYQKTGNYPGAVKAFKEVIRLKPDDLSTYYNLGLACYYNRNFEEAQAAFDVAQKKFGDNPDILYYDALAHYNVGEVDETIGNLKTINKKYPNYNQIETGYLLALAYFYKGMADEAAQQFNTVVKVAPDYTNWDKQARNYIIQIEQRKAIRLKELSFNIFANAEHDSNVAYAANPVPADADMKITFYGALNYRPVLWGEQNLKLGYSFYNLTYGTHPGSNLLGNMGEVSYNFYPLGGTLLALKTNFNLYNMGGNPYLFNLPVDCRFTFKVLPGAGMWSIVYAGCALDNYIQAYYQKQSSNSMIVGLKQFINDNLSIGYEGKILAASGADFGGTHTDDYSYQSHQLSFNYITMLPEAFSLSFDGSYSLKNYTNPDSYTISTRPTKRTDNILSVAATLSKIIFWELGLMLKISYLSDNSNLTSSQSALGYGSYTSNAVSLGVARSF
jgi:cytochrome c-type biogenesis protein CcmH/NrfG